MIANGVSLDKFQLNPELHEPCHRFCRSLSHSKRLSIFVSATIAKLKDQKIIFKIAGSGANIDNPEIKVFFDEYELDSSKVELLDQISDMPVFYQSIDAFLMTSITEGFPNVLLEAMASGLPCISTDVGDANILYKSLAQ